MNDQSTETRNQDLPQNSGQLLSRDTILPNTLLIIPIHSSPVFPGMIAPLLLTKPEHIQTAEEALTNPNAIIGLILNKSNPENKPELYSVGTAVRILRKLNTTDGGVTVLVHSLKRFRTKKVVRETPFHVLQVTYEDDVFETANTRSIELDALARSVLSQIKKLSETNPFFTEEIRLAMINAPNQGVLADLVAFALALEKEDAQNFLETKNVKERFEKLLFHLKKEQEVSDIQRKINEEVSQKIQKAQKEYFLKEQLRTIRKELGGSEKEDGIIDSFKQRIESVKLTTEAKKIAQEELHKLETTSENSPEFNVIRNYLDWMLSLPWGITTKDDLDLKKARKILDTDHFGIPKIKDRILEFLAVKKLNPNSKGSVLCFVGPPGVGKTSLGKSIAHSMGREFFRFSLGGMRDEAEIKGHRRTYIGAMPGKLLNALKRVGSQNPVLLLDEIDKMGQSFQGDPASALLEVLDPEQNNSFLDHYLDVPFDLSQVMFILTANSTSTIPSALLDRMEVIELNGYTLEEKEAIARTHVLPKEIEKHGLQGKKIIFSKETLKKIMHGYSREPGMRSMQQNIASILRKIATKVVENNKLKQITVHPKDVYEYLGPEKFENDNKLRTDVPGVVVGLAWTPLGGQTLYIEAGDVPRYLTKEKSQSESNFGQFKLTGQLGDVMSESAAIAYSYVKKKTKKDLTARGFFDKNDIHLHIPAGAIPKDGPSAGVTMATALLSLVTGKKVRKNLAMTGELSLVGKVLPVGGIKEKVLAAKRIGIKTIVLPQQNKKDLKEIPHENLKGLKFVFAKTIEDVFKAALH